MPDERWKKKSLNFPWRFPSFHLSSLHRSIFATFYLCIFASLHLCIFPSFLPSFFRVAKEKVRQQGIVNPTINANKVTSSDNEIFERDISYLYVQSVKLVSCWLLRLVPFVTTAEEKNTQGINLPKKRDQKILFMRRLPISSHAYILCVAILQLWCVQLIKSSH